MHIQFQNDTGEPVVIIDKPDEQEEGEVQKPLEDLHIKTINVLTRPRISLSKSPNGDLELTAHGQTVLITDSNRGSQLGDTDSGGGSGGG